ncbi:crossover junction endodeoxyribonuclease RuvC [Niabella drilacis]|uniref:Crossover junction endodeoxyribonuclease RuvC n=1 Tax=Niabella drilacis (strain DSM 25811 / CCM 8410 / CCUG 62505 / LMG 26954 / E90) TaxID=1285928 RepID=A0A1G6YRQ8_NIADE|nr:crossover junction endodeoxyribonuclease RuvC [Niabella drilacis]SDD92246.1 Holliday junction endonuclease RuvC [Niabella drilacis]
MQTAAKIILGIDPGTLIMGYSIIECTRQKIQVREMHAIKFAARLNNYERLSQIHEKVTALIHLYKPHEFAIEAPFFGKNVQSMLKLGRAQGVAIAAAMHFGIPITEYSPRKIKQAVTGNGNAAKDQVWKMLQQILSLKEAPEYFDATDALAVALCHHYQISSPIKTVGGFKGWEDFLKKNPDKIKK